MREIENAALAFDRAARLADVKYAFMGGLAVMAWGQPRATADIDVLLHLDEGAVGRFASALTAEGFSVDARDLVDAMTDTSHVTIFDDLGAFHIDVKLARGERELDELRHAREVTFRDGRLRIVAPEETIAFKLKFGSPQDLQDARSIAIRQAKALDLPRLRALARDLGVEAALDDLLKL